jgi:hypothetical protein
MDTQDLTQKPLVNLEKDAPAYCLTHLSDTPFPAAVGLLQLFCQLRQMHEIGDVRVKTDRTLFGQTQPADHFTRQLKWPVPRRRIDF